MCIRGRKSWGPQNSASCRCGTIGGGLEMLSPALARVQDRKIANSLAEDGKEDNQEIVYIGPSVWQIE